MNKNHVMLSIVLVCMLATQTAVCAQDKAGLINKAQETYRTFKKDMKCVFSKQPCTRSQKKRLIKQGTVLTGIVVVLAGLGIGGAFGIRALKKRGKRELLPDPLLVLPPEEVKIKLEEVGEKLGKVQEAKRSEQPLPGSEIQEAEHGVDEQELPKMYEINFEEAFGRDLNEKDLFQKKDDESQRAAMSELEHQFEMRKNEIESHSRGTIMLLMIKMRQDGEKQRALNYAVLSNFMDSLEPVEE